MSTRHTYANANPDLPALLERIRLNSCALFPKLGIHPLTRPAEHSPTPCQPFLSLPKHTNSVHALLQIGAHHLAQPSTHPHICQRQSNFASLARTHQIELVCVFSKLGYILPQNLYNALYGDGLFVPNTLKTSRQDNIPPNPHICQLRSSLVRTPQFELVCVVPQIGGYILIGYSRTTLYAIRAVRSLNTPKTSIRIQRQRHGCACGYSLPKTSNRQHAETAHIFCKNQCSRGLTQAGVGSV